MRLTLLLLFGLFLHSVSSADFCSQFTNCESCAGRHHVTFEVCTWCPAFNSCLSPSKVCRSGYRTVYDCPRLMTVSYNETFARSVVTPLIAAAQGSFDQMIQCLAKVEGKIQLWKRFTVHSEEGKERPDAFVAVDFTRRAVIASFSSVAGGSKLLYNRFNAEFFTNRQAQFETSDGLVNRFIYDGWFKLWYVLDMEKTLRNLFAAHPDFEFWVVGHALGGAKAEMAAIAALTKNLTTSDKVKLLTFGTTRLGDLSFVEMVETMVPYRFRVVHDHDMVVRYPKEFDGEWTPPHHHRYEVWYPNDMAEGSNYLVCLGAEDPQCSARLTPWQLRAEDNDMYFERSMERWALTGCDDKDKAPKSTARVKTSNIGSPIYDIVALRTAKPYITTTVPPSLAPTHPTPKITLPPRHLAPTESTVVTEATTTVTTTTFTSNTVSWTTLTTRETTPSSTTISTTTTVPPTTPAVETTSKKNFTLPWWYTTAPWSSTTRAPISATPKKEWDDGKGPETLSPKKFTTFGNSGAWWSPDGSSFRSRHSFRGPEKIRFRSVDEPFAAAAVVEGTHPSVLQEIGETESGPWSDGIRKDSQRRTTFERHSATNGQKVSKQRTAAPTEEVLTLVDREASETVPRVRSSSRKTLNHSKIWKRWNQSRTTVRPRDKSIVKA